MCTGEQESALQVHFQRVPPIDYTEYGVHGADVHGARDVHGLAGVGVAGHLADERGGVPVEDGQEMLEHLEVEGGRDEAAPRLPLGPRAGDQPGAQPGVEHLVVIALGDVLRAGQDGLARAGEHLLHVLTADRTATRGGNKSHNSCTTPKI